MTEQTSAKHFNYAENTSLFLRSTLNYYSKNSLSFNTRHNQQMEQTLGRHTEIDSITTESTN